MIQKLALYSSIYRISNEIVKIASFSILISVIFKSRKNVILHMWKITRHNLSFGTESNNPSFILWVVCTLVPTRHSMQFSFLSYYSLSAVGWVTSERRFFNIEISISRTLSRDLASKVSADEWIVSLFIK